MRCPACSEPLAARARFCSRCGAGVPAASAGSAHSLPEAPHGSASAASTPALAPLPPWVDRVPQSEWVTAAEFRFRRPSGWEHAAYQGEPGRPVPSTVAAILFGPDDDGYRSTVTVYRHEPCTERRFRYGVAQLAEARRQGAPVASGFTPGFDEPQPGLPVYFVAYQQVEIRYDVVVSEAWLQRSQNHKSGFDLTMMLVNRFRARWLDQNELFCVDYASTLRSHDGALLTQILGSWTWSKAV